jgi:hypothetical protein
MQNFRSPDILYARNTQEIARNPWRSSFRSILSKEYKGNPSEIEEVLRDADFHLRIAKEVLKKSIDSLQILYN